MKKLMAVFILLMLTLVPESCLRQPPSVDDVESFMKKNWNDIVIVNDFLLELENSWAILSDDDGLIFIDFVDQRIEDERVSQKVGAEADPTNFLLMHAMGPNVAGVIGTAVAAGTFMAIFGVK